MNRKTKAGIMLLIILAVIIGIVAFMNMSKVTGFVGGAILPNIWLIIPLILIVPISGFVLYKIAATGEWKLDWWLSRATKFCW